MNTSRFSLRRHDAGFGVVEVLLILVVVVALGGAGWYVWQRERNTKTNATQNKTQTSTTPTPNPTPDAYAGWKTYTDTGYAEASGITIKYPSDWQVKVGDNKAFAWTIVHGGSPQASINVRDVFLNASTTAQQEWTDCPSSDACGPAPGDTTLSSSASTINGLDSYSVKVQNSTGSYYATVIKGNKPLSNGTVVFVEFILNGTDTSTVDTYNKIVQSAQF